MDEPRATGPVDLPLPVLGGAVPPGTPADPVPVELPDGTSVWLMDVGLACCAVELAAACAPAGPGEAPGRAGEPGPENVLVVSGTLTDVMAPALRRLYDSLPEPRRVVAFGACASSGGPYWDSYSVTTGAHEVVPVDVYVPGCPPRPEALRQGLARLRETAAGGAR